MVTEVFSMHDEQNIDLDTAYNVPTKILMSMAAANFPQQ